MPHRSTPFIPWIPGYPRPRGRPQNEKTVPLKIRSPMMLKNKVLGQGSKQIDSVCVQEMTRLYECLNNHDFKDQHCMKQMTSYHDCVFAYKVKLEEQRKQMEKGIPTPNGRQMADLNFKQLNTILARYPQFNKTK